MTVNFNSWHFKMLPAVERIRLRSAVELVVPELGECMVYNGQRSKDGYGIVRIERKHQMVHKVMWSDTHGPVPEGHQLDHLCKNEPCWRLEHLEIVTPRDNVLRSSSPAAENYRKTHCKNGHELTGDNLALNLRAGRKRPTRICKACSRENTAAYRARQMAMTDAEADMNGYGQKQF